MTDFSLLTKLAHHWRRALMKILSGSSFPNQIVVVDKRDPENSIMTFRHKIANNYLHSTKSLPFPSFLIRPGCKETPCREIIIFFPNYRPVNRIL